MSEIVQVIESSNFALTRFELDPYCSHSSDYIHLQSLLARNEVLTRRVQDAALRCLPNAHIMLNAKPLLSHSIDQSSNKSSIFPLFDFPSEIIELIVRHTSGDAYALSEGQFTRLITDAQGKEGLARLIGTPPMNGYERGVRKDWLKRCRLWKWEMNGMGRHVGSRVW